ncbi:hypothetical protein BUE80_DR011758 [Diplocarpon rosae]|nr:hypothetical protein BUE80_DR011758 [Diplocarpon rosae]
MPFRASKVQSKIMEPADSRPCFGLTFLNFPLSFHAPRHAPFSPLASPLSPSSHQPSTNTGTPSPTCTQKLSHNANSLLSSTSHSRPLSVSVISSSLANLNHRKHLDAIHEVDEGLPSPEPGMAMELYEHHVLERRVRRRLLIELTALFTLLVFLLGIVVLCVQGGNGMEADGRLGREVEGVDINAGEQ